MQNSRQGETHEQVVPESARAWNFRQEEKMLRRQLISPLPKLFGLSVLGLGTADAQTTEAHKSLNITIKSAWGSDDPTRASFPFVHGLALADAGH
jgi:hypothetical protein